MYNTHIYIYVCNDVSVYILYPVKLRLQIYNFQYIFFFYKYVQFHPQHFYSAQPVKWTPAYDYSIKSTQDSNETTTNEHSIIACNSIKIFSLDF